MDINGLRDFRQTLVVRGIAQGAVTASKTVSVKFLGTTIRCRAGRGVTTAAGDVVLAIRQGYELIVIERFHAAAPSADPAEPGSSFPDNPWDSIQQGTTVLRPVETRSYRSPAGWTGSSDTLQGRWSGKLFKGCAFYGKGPRSLAGVEVLTTKLKLKRPSDSPWSSNQSTTLRRFTNKTRPKTDDVDLIDGVSIDGPKLSRGESVDFSLPDSWGQDLVDGDSGGLAIYTASADPAAKLAGRGTWSPAWSLTVTWRRVI